MYKRFRRAYTGFPTGVNFYTKIGRFAVVFVRFVRPSITVVLGRSVERFRPSLAEDPKPPMNTDPWPAQNDDHRSAAALLRPSLVPGWRYDDGSGGR